MDFINETDLSKLCRVEDILAAFYTFAKAE